MAHVGVLCLPLPSHVSLFLTLARALSAHEHKVTFFGPHEIEERVLSHGFSFTLLGASFPSLLSEMAQAKALAGIRLQRQWDLLRSEEILKGGPALLATCNLQVLLVDQAEACGGSVAERAGLAWITVCSALCLNSEPRVPPFFTSWNYAATSLAVVRNEVAFRVARFFVRPVQHLINRYRAQWHMTDLRRLDDAFSPYAQICQQIREFDFPRTELPRAFHYVGPIRPFYLPRVDFPWEQLDGRPLIYASLGTLFNNRKRIFHLIAEACEELPVQLVISLGGGETDEYDDLPGLPIVVKYAPQRELLATAALMVTHAGLNSTLESLAEGVPLVAIPIASEQPGIAARIRWTGTGEMIAPSRLTSAKLKKLVQLVLNKDSYREAAKIMQNALARQNGTARTVEIVEEVLKRAGSKSEGAINTK